MAKNQIYYLELLNRIMFKYGLVGGFIHLAYANAIKPLYAS